jgi:hypothetical protein
LAADAWDQQAQRQSEKRAAQGEEQVQETASSRAGSDVKILLLQRWLLTAAAAAAKPAKRLWSVAADEIDDIFGS